MIRALSLLFLFIISTPVFAYDWSSLWLNRNQQGAQLLNKNQPEQALKYFQDPNWQAAAAYRAKDYKKSSKLLANIPTSDAQYNLGNALAKQGQYQEAIDAYDNALKQNPNNKDAQYNRELVKNLLLAQEQQQQQSSAQQNNNSKTPPNEQQQSDPEPKESEQPKLEKNEQEQADEQRLRQIPDDPGGLLRRKFLRDHERMQGR
jgi:Ca-activated chloride channel family protein